MVYRMSTMHYMYHNTCMCCNAAGVTVEVDPTVVREGNFVSVIVREQPQLQSDINIKYNTLAVTAEGGNTSDGACTECA